ncbi:MAG: hypothetical protein M1548_02520 [Actinobacteria bacterium]|nr:hypothetical protein [Actinomycetota bacterium]
MGLGPIQLFGVAPGNPALIGVGGAAGVGTGLPAGVEVPGSSAGGIQVGAPTGQLQNQAARFGDVIAYTGQLTAGAVPFIYSVTNPPPLEELESRLFAVHATPIFPEGGILKAGARGLSPNNGWKSDHPSFRPTIHFSLGELVRPHGRQSWENMPYAIVVPIRALEEQLVNLFPEDTFILGDYRLTSEATILVMKGTNVSGLSPDIRVVEYDKETGLRTAIDQLIREKGGWPIRTRVGGEIPMGNMAHIGDVDINRPEFFASLLGRFPHLSYGSHVSSEVGEAFRFGVLDQALSTAMKTYSDHWGIYSTEEVQLYRAIIMHNLSRLEAFIRAQYLEPSVVAVFENKKMRLLLTFPPKTRPFTSSVFLAYSATKEERNEGKTIHGGAENSST